MPPNKVEKKGLSAQTMIKDSESIFSLVKNKPKLKRLSQLLILAVGAAAAFLVLNNKDNPGAEELKDWSLKCSKPENKIRHEVATDHYLKTQEAVYQWLNQQGIIEKISHSLAKKIEKLLKSGYALDPNMSTKTHLVFVKKNENEKDDVRVIEIGAGDGEKPPEPGTEGGDPSASSGPKEEDDEGDDPLSSIIDKVTEGWGKETPKDWDNMSEDDQEYERQKLDHGLEDLRQIDSSDGYNFETLEKTRGDAKFSKNQFALDAVDEIGKKFLARFEHDLENLESTAQKIARQDGNEAAQDFLVGMITEALNAYLNDDKTGKKIRDEIRDLLPQFSEPTNDQSDEEH